MNTHEARQDVHAHPVRLLLVSGSTRSGSTNTATLRTVLELSGEGVDSELWEDLTSMPPFVPGVDPDTHQAVTSLRERLDAVDAVIICTPEYAGTIPGSLKNALDWLVGTGELNGKPVSWITVAAPGRGTGAEATLATVLRYVDADVIDAACGRVPVARDLVGPNGTVEDPGIRAALARLIDLVVEHVGDRAGHQPVTDHPQRRLDDRALFDRQARSLVTSWVKYATASSGAEVTHENDVTICVFPSEPERSVYNNALIARGLQATAAARAVETIEKAYADAGIVAYAAWVHESDHTTIAELARRGFHFDSSTRAMAMPLDELRLPIPEVDLADADWSDYLRILGLPEDFLEGIDATDFHVQVAKREGRNVATAMACDHDGDCGIYNVLTLPDARRRGLGTALTALHAHRARERGCTTASLQSTEMAEHVYAAVGFRDLGRFLEYVR